MREERSPLEIMIDDLIHAAYSNRVIARELEEIPSLEEHIVEFLDGNADVIENAYNKLIELSGIKPCFPPDYE